MYIAFLDNNNICIGLSIDLSEEGILVDRDVLGMKYKDGIWIEPTSKPKQPTNAEVAQMISDLQADLIILQSDLSNAGVI